jgi:hypothetical protein
MGATGRRTRPRDPHATSVAADLLQRDRQGGRRHRANRGPSRPPRPGRVACPEQAARSRSRQPGFGLSTSCLGQEPATPCRPKARAWRRPSQLTPKSWTLSVYSTCSRRLQSIERWGNAHRSRAPAPRRTSQHQPACSPRRATQRIQTRSIKRVFRDLRAPTKAPSASRRCAPTSPPPASKASARSRSSPSSSPVKQWLPAPTGLTRPRRPET